MPFVPEAPESGDVCLGPGFPQADVETLSQTGFRLHFSTVKEENKISSF